MVFVKQSAKAENGIVTIKTSRDNLSVLNAFLLTSEFRQMQEENYGTSVSTGKLARLLTNDSKSARSDKPDLEFVIPSYVSDIKDGTRFTEADISSDKIITYLLTKKYSEKSVLLISNCVSTESVYKEMLELHLTGNKAAALLNGLVAENFTLRIETAKFLAESFRSFMKKNKTFEIYPGQDSPLDALVASPDEDESFYDSADGKAGEKKRVLKYDYSEIEPLIALIEKCVKHSVSAEEAFLEKNNVLKNDVE